MGVVAASIRTCNACGEEKPLEEFVNTITMDTVDISIDARRVITFK